MTPDIVSAFAKPIIGLSVAGATFMTTGSLADGVHPTTAGHGLYAAAVKTILGIS